MAGFADEAPPLSLDLIGVLRVRRGTDAVDLTSRKARLLLACVARTGPVSRARVATLLWPDADERAARTSLRQCLSSLHRTLDMDDRRALLADATSLRLGPGMWDVDVERFDAACDRGARAIDADADADAIALVRGPFLDGTDEPAIDAELDEWIRGERQRIRERHLAALERQLARCETAGDHVGAVQIGQALLLEDPLQEPVHRRLITSYARLGRLNDARVQYERCAEVLMRELGIKPQTGTRRHLLFELGESRADAKSLPANDVAEPLAASVAAPVAGCPGRTEEAPDVIAGDQDAGAAEHWSRPAASPRWARPGVLLVATGILLAAMAIASLAPERRALPSPPAYETTFSAVTPSITAQRSLPSLAVLPFFVAGEQAEVAYLGEGIAEDLITDLARVSGLFVLSRRASFGVALNDADPVRIANSLGVRYLLDGSVRRVSDRLRINVSLLDGETGKPVWSDRFDRRRSTIVALQDDIVASIVSSLSVGLTDRERQRLASHRPVDADAYDLLLRGLQPFRTLTPEGNALARRWFQRALEVDPDFARAHANLALSHAREIVFRYGTDQADTIEQGLAAAAKAEALDPDLPQLHFTKAVLSLARRDHAQAVSAARRAVALDPNYADGHAILAQTLVHAGVHDEGFVSIVRARQLDPLHTFAYLFVQGHALFLMKEHERALPVLVEAVARNPAFEVARVILAANYARLGLLNDAAWQLDELATLSAPVTLTSERTASLYARTADLDYVLESLSLAGADD